MATSKNLAKVGNIFITEADIDATIEALGPRGQAYNNPEGRQAVLDQLIAKNLFLFEAQNNSYENDPKFKSDLAKVRDEMLANFAIEKELSSIEVTDDEVKKFYDEHKNEFVSGESVEASHILVDSEEKAKNLLADIKSGAISFAEAAKANSSCPSAEQGGSLGKFTRGQMVPEFDTAAFSMNVGDISEPIKTQFGYHLIHLTAKNEASEIPFEQIRENLVQKVLMDKQQAAYSSKLNQLKLLFPIEMF